MFNSFLAFCFWKAFTFSSFERFLCWKSRNYSQIYLSGIINYWGSILTLYITWGAFSLVCVLSVFFSSFLSCFVFFFYRYFHWQTRFIRWDGRENNNCPCFSLPAPNEYSFNSSRFLSLFTWSICNYQTYSWWDLFAFLWMQLSRSYWLWHFQVTLLGFEFISKYHPSITK